MAARFFLFEMPSELPFVFVEWMDYYLVNPVIFIYYLVPWHGTDLDEYLCSGSLRRNAGKKTQDGSILIIHLPFF